MGGLKEHQFCESDEFFREYTGPLSNETHLYYLKSEADKVIAELEERIADGDKDFEMANHQNERLLKIVRHHKYKRCLDNAEICCEKKENCYNRALRKYSKNEADYLVHKSEFWQDWEFRWLELAEKFNEGV